MLPYDFTLYGAASPAAWSAIPDNGYVSAAAGVATVTGTIVPKVYDATVSVPLQSALQGVGPRGEVAVFGPPPSVQYATKNVGTGKQVQLTGTFSASFTDPLGKPAFGLTLQSGMTGDITPATLNLTGLSAANKVYDAGLTTALTGTPSITPLGGDSVSLVGTPIGTFADKNVGTAKPVSVFGVGLTGADNANYVLATPSNLTADITPFQLSLGGATVNNKVYDATVNATLSGTSTADFFAGDSAALTGGTIAFTDKNVGTNKSVQLSGFGLTGADAPNYLPPTTTLLTASITTATLNLNGLSAANKVYDATTTAALTGNPSVTPLAGDSVSLIGSPVGAFADKNVGTAKAVTVSNVGLSGTDSANYVLAAPTSLTASITPATLLIDGFTAANKVYDGNTVATLLGTGSYEPIGSDNVVVVGQPVGTFSSKNVGTADRDTQRAWARGHRRRQLHGRDAERPHGRHHARQPDRHRRERHHQGL